MHAIATQPRTPRHRLALIAASLFACALALCLWIVRDAPTIYYWDAYERIALHDQLVVRRWLPALQAVVSGVMSLTADVAILRVVLAVISAGAVAAAFACGTRMGGARAALIGALWLASNRMFIEFATVPYQEQLLFLFVFAGFWSFELGESGSRVARVAAIVCMNLACMTRYEGWLALGALALDRAWSSRDAGRLRALVAAARLFVVHGGILIAIWLASGLFFFVGEEAQLEKRFELAFVLDILRKFASSLWRHGGALTIAIGACGLLTALLRRPAAPMARRLALLLAADLGMNLTLDPFDSGRRAFVAIILLSVFAGQGAEQVATWCASRLARLRSAQLLRAATWSAFGLALALQFGRGVQAGLGDVHKHASDPLFVSAHEAGVWLAANAPRDARVIPLVEHEVQYLALRTWTRVDVVNTVEVSLAAALEIAPTHLVDLHGDEGELARWRAALEPRAALELVFAPRAGEPPRIWRVTAR